MNTSQIEDLVIDILVGEMGYDVVDAVRLAGRHRQVIHDAIRFLPRRLAMQIEKEETSNAERLAR